jgi:hypothetical protein
MLANHLLPRTRALLRETDHLAGFPVSQRLHASERRASSVEPPGAFKMEYMVGHLDRWAGPRSLRHVGAALDLAYQSTMARMLHSSWTSTGKHVMGRLPNGEAPTNIRERYKHALDNCCDSVRSLGTWTCHLLHPGRLGPHSSHSGGRDSCHPPDPGAKSSIVTPDVLAAQSHVLPCVPP